MVFPTRLIPVPVERLSCLESSDVCKLAMLLIPSPSTEMVFPTRLIPVPVERLSCLVARELSRLLILVSSKVKVVSMYE